MSLEGESLIPFGRSPAGFFPGCVHCRFNTRWHLCSGSDGAELAVRRPSRLNVAHGEFIMLGAMVTFTLYTVFNINPLLSVVISGPVIFALGYFLHWILFRYLRDKSASVGGFESNSILAAFGLLFIVQNIAKQAWGSQIRSYSYLNSPVNFGGTEFGADRLMTMGIAVAIGAAFYLFLTRTRTGKAIRAAAQDAVTARLMGVNINVVLALCFGLGALMAALQAS